MLIITDGFPRNLGYYEHDMRARNGQHWETDTFTCSHCQRVVIRYAVTQPKLTDPYLCRGCNHHLCKECAALRAAGAPCITFQQQADIALERAAKGL